MNELNPTKEIAVIGAGIIGVNCALALQSQGFKVTLLDSQRIGEGCSKGNAGHFATEQVFPLAEVNLLWQLPKMLLDPLGPIALSPRYFLTALPWFLRFINNMRPSKRAHNSAALKALNRHAIDYYRPWLTAAKAEHLLTCMGSLVVYENTPLPQIQKAWQHYVDADVGVTLLNRQQTMALEPNLSERVQHALYFTDVAHTVDPYQLCLVLAELALSNGAQFKQFTVKKISQQGHKVVIGDGQQSLQFDQAVVATGAWSKTLLAQLGYNLPMETERGYSLTLTEHAKLRRPVASAERRFIMTPMAMGLRLAGTVEFAGLEQPGNFRRAEMLYRHAQQLLTQLPATDLEQISPDHKWLGFRPSLPDSLPVICRAPRHDNIYFALGHQHLGLTQGAITGKLIAQLISNQSTDIDIKPFSIKRFQ